MRVGTLLAVAVVLLGSAHPVAAQVVSLEFDNGRVRLVAENVPVSSILAEWARLGRTTFVNGDRLSGAPVSIVLDNVPEKDALAVVLRRASGYVSATRASTADGASTIDRVFILPTSSPVMTTAPPPPAPEPAFVLPEEDVPPDLNDPTDLGPDGPTDLGPDGPPATSPFGARTGRVSRQLLGPDVPPEPAVNEPEETPPARAPGNPFGVMPGSARPGVISPVPGPAPGDAR